MRQHKRRRAGDLPPMVDPVFAEALAGETSPRPRRKPDYKVLQLCRQAQEALILELAGGDEILRDLYIADVTPMPDASHLLVHVIIPPHLAVVEALARLERAVPWLRAGVARAITRKKAPGLSFIPAASGEVMP